MKKLLNNKMFKNYIIILTFIMALEITFRLISGIDVLDTALLRIFLSANIIAACLSYVYSWISKKAQKWFIIFTCLFLTLYAFLQLGFNNFIGVYISVNTSSQLGAVTDYVREFFTSFLWKFYLIIIPFGVLALYYIFIDQYTLIKNNKRFPLKKSNRYEGGIRTISTLLLLTIFCGLYYESLTIPFMQNELQTVSTKELFKNPTVPSTVVNEFGVLGFGALDIKTLYTGISETPIYFAGNDSNIVSNRTFDDTLWKEVIEEEDNETIKSIHNYLINNNISDYNEYTGIFSGKNLIVIMLESVNEVFINKEYYPNFYKMYSEGWSIKNNYSPRNSCSTGNNEFSGMTGLYTIYNNCTANVYKNNTYDTSIFNLFKESGYKTSSMHNYTEAYYYRRTIHNNLGSEKYYGVQDLGIPYYNEYRNWSSDEDFMEVAMDITLEDTNKPFMLWLTTVSSHQPYVVASEEGDKYIDLFADTEYPKDLQRYMSKLKTLDNALGILLERLESAGILKDTVIAMYGDHYPYGLSNDTLNHVLEYDLSEYEVERTPMVIYNSEITPQVVDKYSSFINLTPTLANLFNLDYDPRLYMGTDLFSNEYLNIVTFADGSWKNDDLFYDASDGSVKYYNEESMDIEEIKNINNIIISKMQISSLIIRNNYFGYLEDALEALKNKKESIAIDLGEDNE